MAFREKTDLKFLFPLTVLSISVSSVSAFGLVRLFPIAGTLSVIWLISAIIVISLAASAVFYLILKNHFPSAWFKGGGASEKSARKQFASFMDDLPLGVFLKDKQSRAIYLNNFMDQIFGKSNCLGKTPYNIYDSEKAARVMEEDKRVLAGESIMIEEVLSDKNGRKRVYMTHKFPMYNGYGDETRIGGILIEITRRKEAEYKLRILSKAIRNSPVCVLITDPDGNIEFVNPAFVNSTGYSFAEVMGKNMNIINSGKHEKEFFRRMWKRIKSGMDWQGEILNKKKDGTLFWEMVNISSVTNKDDEITHFVAIKDDISKRKQMEDALLKAKDKAEESDNLKSAFLANMSHEIRTPMNAIVGLSGMLDDPGLTNEERENFSKIIKENSAILLQLIDDIVDISKIEAGQISIRPGPCNPNSLMNDILNSFRMQAVSKEQKVDLIFKRDSDLDELNTLADQQRLRQIISNLVGNALKFTKKGYVEFGMHYGDSNNLLFYVKDTGIGIPEDKLEHIFDRFGQVDDNGASNHRGAGLGLSISRSLVELMGGKIWVESVEGKGSCFWLTIPYRQVSVDEKYIDIQPGFMIRPDLKDWNILIIEDLEVNYRLIAAMLKKTGATVIWAKNGREALELCSGANQYSLILLDLNLPDTGGLELLGKIRQLAGNIPVIIQTAYAMNDEKERCLEAGCRHYITKPIQNEQLMAAIIDSIAEESSSIGEN